MRSGRAIAFGGMRKRWTRLVRRKSPGEIVFDSFNYLFLTLFSATILYSVWSTLLLSFSGVGDATALGFHIWLPKWRLTAYEFAFSRYGNVGVAYFNSIVRTLLGTFLTVLCTLLAAYPLSKRRLPGRNLFTLYVLVTMFFSGGIIPLYLVVRRLGLFDTRLALILPEMAMGFYVIIMRNFLMTIDNAYEESAFIDGANYFQVLLKLVIPLSKPVLAVIALWTAVWHWNEWFHALIFIRSESKIVLQILLRRLIHELIVTTDTMVGMFLREREVELPTESIRAAIVILTIGPIIFLYPFLQKYFNKGVFMGSLKG